MENLNAAHFDADQVRVLTEFLPKARQTITDFRRDHNANLPPGAQHLLPMEVGTEMDRDAIIAILMIRLHVQAHDLHEKRAKLNEVWKTSTALELLPMEAARELEGLKDAENKLFERYRRNVATIVKASPAKVNRKWHDLMPHLTDLLSKVVQIQQGIQNYYQEAQSAQESS